MLTFKEFVFKSWELRGYPLQAQAEKSWKFHKDEVPHNGWWVRYQAWQAHGCPMPVQDINYDTIQLGALAANPKPTLTFEDFFVAKMKSLSSQINWTFQDHFPGHDPKLVAAWQQNYQAWIESGCPPFSLNKPTVQQKKPIRYLNRVNA